MCVCIYVYTYLYIHIYMHIYIHIYTYIERERVMLFVCLFARPAPRGVRHQGVEAALRLAWYMKLLFVCRECLR